MKKRSFLFYLIMFLDLICFSAQVKTGYWKGIPGQEFKKEGFIYQYKVDLLQWGELIVTRIPVKLGDEEFDEYLSFILDRPDSKQSPVHCLRRWHRFVVQNGECYDTEFLTIHLPEILLFPIKEGSPIIGIIYRYNQDPMVRHVCVNADYIEVQLVDLSTYHSPWLSKSIKVGMENYFSPQSDSVNNDYLAKSTDFVTDCYKPGQIINLVEVSDDKEYGLRVEADVYFYDFNRDGYMDIAIKQVFMRGRKKREKPVKNLLYENFTFHFKRVMKMVYSPRIKRFLNPVQEKSPVYPEKEIYKIFNLKTWLGKR